MNKSFSNQTVLKVISLIFAVLLWFYVGMEQNPTVERTLTVDIVPQGLALGYTVDLSQETAEVVIRGRQDRINHISPSDIKAQCDLKNVHKGDNLVPVTVTVPRRITLKSINPEKVRANIMDAESKAVPLSINITGDHYNGEQGVADYTEIMVYGPTDMLNLVSYAMVTVDIKDLQEGFQELPVHLYDVYNNLIDSPSLRMDPSRVKVDLLEKNNMITKTVEVAAIVDGSPADGYEYTGFTVEPTSVEVKGPQVVLEKMDTILTEPISIQGASAPIKTSVNLALPANVELITGDQLVNVTLNFKYNEVQLPGSVEEESEPLEPVEPMNTYH